MRLRDQEGQTAAEFVGIGFVVVAVIAFLFAYNPGFDAQLRTPVDRQVCEILDSQDCSDLPDLLDIADGTGGGGPGSDGDGDGSRGPGDGAPAELVDSDGDGSADAVDLDGDGVADGTLLDTDGDGIADAIDLDGDGQPDADLTDTDGDGIADAIDLDGDGAADVALEGPDGGDVTTALGPSGDGPRFDPAESPVEPLVDAINNAAAGLSLAQQAALDLSQRGWHVFRHARNLIPSHFAQRYAEGRGGDCNLGAGVITTCTGVERASYWQSGIFQIGNVTITADGYVDDDLQAHETKHADQWALFGFAFPLLYGLEMARARLRRRTSNLYYNFFEWWAGRRDGGYEPDPT